MIFGPSATALAYRISDALSRAWTAGDDIVVSRLDHDSNVRPWIQAAGRAGVDVKWAEVDLVTGELPVAQYADLIGPRTRLVAVTAASNAIGTRPDVAAISELAHAMGALCYVDGVHATPHVPVDVAALGADFFTTSAYKWSGPHLAAAVAPPELLETVWPDKLAPSSNAVPWRFERGTLPFADLAGTTAAVEHLAALAPGCGLRHGLRRVAGVQPGAGHRVDDGRGGVRGGAVRPAARRPGESWTASPCTARPRGARRPRSSASPAWRRARSPSTWPPAA